MESICKNLISLSYKSSSSYSPSRFLDPSGLPLLFGVVIDVDLVTMCYILVFLLAEKLEDALETESLHSTVSRGVKKFLS